MRLPAAIGATLVCVLTAAAAGSAGATTYGGVLGRIKYVAPVMPQAAIDRQLQGFVEVIFVIARDGSLQDLQIADAQPRGVFEEAAIAALIQWRYAPVIEDGKAVEQKAMVRLTFPPPRANK